MQHTRSATSEARAPQARAYAARLRPRRSKSLHGQATVYAEHLTGRVGHFPSDQGGDSSANVVGRAPAPLYREALASRGLRRICSSTSTIMCMRINSGSDLVGRNVKLLRVLEPPRASSPCSTTWTRGTLAHHSWTQPEADIDKDDNATLHVTSAARCWIVQEQRRHTLGRGGRRSRQVRSASPLQSSSSVASGRSARWQEAIPAL